MSFGNIDELGAALARSRDQSECQATPLSRITSDDEARAVQSQAVEAYGGAPRGYVVEATGVRLRRLIGADEPVYGPLLDRDLLMDERPLRLPRGVLGAGCGVALILGRSYPDPNEEISRETAERAVVACHVGIQVLGRRVTSAVPLNAYTATADFVLNVAYKLGTSIGQWPSVDLGALLLTARIDGKVVAQGAVDEAMGHPLDALAWLAKTLMARDRLLEAGEIVTTGSWVGALQVLPGQTFAVHGGDPGEASLVFS